MARKTNKSEPQKVTMLQTVPKKRHEGANTKTSSTRGQFLRAYEASFGNVSFSCEVAGISRMTFYRWMKSSSRINKKFQESIKILQPMEKQLDLAEGALNARIMAGDTTAIIFALKTRGRHRGYQEKVEVQHSVLQQAAKAITDFIARHPDADKEEVIEVFATARGIKKEDIIHQLGGIQ